MSKRATRQTRKAPRNPGAGPTLQSPAIGHGPRLTRAPWFWPIVVFAVAFLLRAIYISQVRHTPFFYTLGLDARYYDEWANRIAGGEGRREAFFMSPLYPYFLAAIYKLFGRDLLLVRFIQAGLGSLSAVLAYVIGARVFDRRVGVVAGLVTACYGALIFYDGAVLLEPLLVLVCQLMLLLLLAADSTRRPLAYLGAGVLLGLAAVGRATVLVFVPIAMLWIWLDRGEDGARARPRQAVTGADRRVRLRAAALLLLGAALVVVPIAVRNYVVSNDFVLLTSNGGLNFYLGNSEISTGGCVASQGHDMVADPPGAWIAEKALGRKLKASEISAYWYSGAKRFIGEHPGAWLKLLVRKLSFAMSSYEVPQLEYYDFQKQYSPLLSLPLPAFGVVAPLGLVGFWLSFRRRRARLLTLFFAMYIFTIVAFFVVDRYRLPAVPPLIVGASFGLFETWRLVRGRAWRALAGVAGALVVLFCLVNANIYHIDKRRSLAQPHFRLGIVYGERGDVGRAIAEYVKSVELDPYYPKSYLNLGALLSETGRRDEAKKAFRSAVRLDPTYTAARVDLAMAFEDEGAYDRAIVELDSVLAYDPRNAMALRERGVALFRSGRKDEARAALREAAKWDTDGTERPEIEFYLAAIERPAGADAVPPEAARAMARGVSLQESGRTPEAEAALREAVSLAPGYGEPLQKLAALKLQMGFPDEAIDLMRRALQVEPTLPHGHFALGVLLSDTNRHDEALVEYEAESRINPNFASAHLNLALTYQFHAGNANLAAYHYRRYLSLGGERVEALDRVLREIGPVEG
jgi:tetratricopeptide (TPR) repeat protein